VATTWWQLGSGGSTAAEAATQRWQFGGIVVSVAAARQEPRCPGHCHGGDKDTGGNSDGGGTDNGQQSTESSVSNGNGNGHNDKIKT
jgi:hypothetical protein